ncbi:GDSL-type esterase/lipase family protein [Paenibacillus sp. JSM ZJ436]|uniref:GDSL-type esterase/lipase family protein n=1 Tax=Paenibacillus sp. JSM ZJ436 TaxID=3376190 RepID=UPI0037B7D028
MVYCYTAVGDSLTYGLGALPGSGFVPLYRRMAEEYVKEFVAYDQLGIPGLTSCELYERIRRDPQFRSSLKGAAIITISAGGNDLIRAAQDSETDFRPELLEQALSRCKACWQGIVNEICKLKKGGPASPYLIRAVGLYNPYPSRIEAAAYVHRLNGFLSGLLPTAQVYSLFAGREQELLSSDGLHPNAKGYRLIAEQLNRLGYRPL